MSLFIMKDIKKTFTHGEVQEKVLKGIDLTLLEGDITALTGSSGSGKSTLLTIAAGLQAATEGKITFDNQELSAMKEKDIRQIRATQFGFIFQFAHLVPFLTVKEQLSLMLEAAESTLSKKEEDIEIQRILKHINMWQRRDAYPASLSGGEKQRVAVARAIIHQPKVLFADEPTASLDSKRSKEVMELIQMLAKERNITVLMVTHDMDVLSYVDHVIEIRDGKIIKAEHTN